jgi:predicted MFS family arabinose efflux permease
MSATSGGYPLRTVVAVVAATTAAQVAGAMGAAVFPIIAPELARTLGVEVSLIGYQMSLIYGAAMLGSMSFAWMVARYGGCRTTQIGMACCAVGLAAGFHSSIAALMVTSVLIGLSMSINLPAAAHLLFRFSPPQHRNFIFSLKQTGVPLAWALMALIAPAVTLTWGWRWALALVLVAALATLLAMQPVREHWDDDRRPDLPVRARVFEGVQLVWRMPALRWLCVAAFCMAFVQLCVSTFTVIMLVEEVDYTLIEAGLMLSVAQIAGVMGRIVWGWLADRTHDSLRVLQWLSAGMLVCCMAIIFLQPDWPVLMTALLFALFGATAIGWNGLYTAEVARRSPPGQVSIATGGAMVWNFGGILAGPTTFTLVYQLLGNYAWTYGCMAVMVLVIFFALAASRRALLAEH